MASPTFVISSAGKVEERALQHLERAIYIAQPKSPPKVDAWTGVKIDDETLYIKVKLLMHRLVDPSGTRKDIVVYWPESWMNAWGVREFMMYVVLKYPTMPYLTQYKLSEEPLG